MLKRTNLLLGAYAIAALALCAACGCIRGDTGQTNVKGPSQQERIAAIEKDSSMPPQAKAMAIQQLKGREAAGNPVGGGGKQQDAAAPK